MSKCKICKEEYTRERYSQSVCSYTCALIYGNKMIKKRSESKVKIARSDLKEFNDSDVGVLKKKAQSLVNKYARLRDEKENGYRCCTCGHATGQMDGGHFLPTSGYSAIRYNTNQIHQQCKKCNRFNGGMPKEYRVFMINKYGLEYVERLENTKSVLRRYNVDYYLKLIVVIKKKIKRIAI